MIRFVVSKSRNSLFRGAITLFLGGVFLFVPGLTMKSVMIIIGSMLIVSGLVTMLVSVFGKRGGINHTIGSASGIMNILFGFVFIAMPDTMVKIFVFILGMILLLMGTLQLFGASASRLRSVWTLIYLLIALATLASGAFLLSNPFKSAETILSFIGVILVINGASEMVNAWRLKKQPQTFNGQEVQDTTYEEI